MEMDVSWWLLLPLPLSVLYGYTQARAKAALNLPVRRFWVSWLATALLTAALVWAWILAGFPLPVFILLVYLLQSVRLLVDRPVVMKNWFILNLNYANFLTILFVLVAIAALVRNAPMSALLTQPFWRTMSVSAALAVTISQDCCFLLWPNFAARFSEVAQSEEARPVMACLWFCAGYLLIDSTLCVFELDPLYPPLFLIGSSLVVMFALIRFLLHIDKLLINQHLKEEHDQLASKLEATEESADTLRQLARRDVLTGVASRRWVMERIEELIQADMPFALAFLDLDALKRVNDLQGHDAGDAYLRGFARELGNRIREGDLLARVGGDEFLVLMPDCPAGIADERMQAIRWELDQADRKDGPFRFSYGVSAFPDGKTNAEQLLQEADQAMYQDKMQRRQGGRGQ